MATQLASRFGGVAEKATVEGWVEQVEHVSSAGVGILAACYTSATNVDRRLCLAHVSNRVRMILDVVKISDVLCIFATEKEAIQGVCK